MIEKIRMNREQTRRTLVIDGSEASKAFTTKRIPSSLLITLRGLNPRNDLNDFSAYNYCMSIPITMKLKSIIETVTTKRSS